MSFVGEKLCIGGYDHVDEFGAHLAWINTHVAFSSIEHLVKAIDNTNKYEPSIPSKVVIPECNCGAKNVVASLAEILVEQPNALF